MVRVSAFSLSGRKVFFNTSDHSPPHFHVLNSGEWEIRVNIDESSEANGLVYSVKFARKLKGKKVISSKEEKDILNLVIRHHPALLRQWQQQVSTREII